MSDEASDVATEGARDGASDVAADAPGASFLACTAWELATPIALDDRSDGASGAFGGVLWIGEVSPGVVRVIAQPEGDAGFRVYTVDKGSGTVTTVDGALTPGARFLGAHDFVVAGDDGGAATVTEILVSDQEGVDASSEQARVTAYLVPGSIGAAGPLPSPIVVATTGGTTTMMPLDATSVFAAIQYLSLDAPPDIGYSLAVGVATSSSPAPLAQVAGSTHSDDFLAIALANASGNIYLFASNSAATLGESAWVVPASGILASPPPARAFDTGTLGVMVDVAAGAAAGTTNFAYLQGAADLSSVTVRVGSIDEASLGSVAATQLGQVRTYTDPALFPQHASQARWTGDDIVLAWPGLAPTDGGSPSGANLLWVDALGNARAEQVAASVILRDRGPIAQIVGSVASQSASTATLDFAWIEESTTGGVLYYDALDCSPGD